MPIVVDLLCNSTNSYVEAQLF